MCFATLPIRIDRKRQLNAEQLMATAQDNFVRNLGRYLKQYGIKRKDLAAAVGVSTATISLWMKKKRSPELSRLEPVARKLGVTVPQLLQDEDDPPLKQRQVDALISKIAKVDRLIEELANARGYELKRKRG